MSDTPESARKAFDDLSRAAESNLGPHGGSPDTIDPDPWIRFDMWAERAHAYLAEAIDIERGRGDNTETCALVDMLDHASYAAWSLAAAAAPKHNANQPSRLNR